MQRRGAALDLAGKRLHTRGQQQSKAADDRRMAEGEPETHRERLAGVLGAHAGGPPRFVVGHQLPGRVVHCGDVVGIERVPEPERVGENPHAHVEDGVVAAEVVVVRHDQPEQDAEAGHVQGEDQRRHAGETATVMPIQACPEVCERRHLPRTGERARHAVTLLQVVGNRVARSRSAGVQRHRVRFYAAPLRS